ncbi:MAG: hypothetical protein MN733_37820 [Nitrososphaera sp.]|nr:hypothetical protein [Nitrososphaera sp.]
MEILIGADPELFVKDAFGTNISGHDLIPGTKRRPYQVDRGAVQVDGTALEFNIDPAKTEDEFVQNVKRVMDQLRAMIPGHMSLDLSAVARYEADYFHNLPDAVKAMGCDPDFDAYSGVEIEHRGHHEPMRTASGHIHIGWTRDEDPFKARHYQSCRTLVRELDLWLGLPSVIFDKESGPRRAMYGKAGSFRPKPYGCEYRVLSNKWLQSEELMRWVYGQTHKAFDFLMSGQRALQHSINPDKIREIINNSDTVLAEAMLTALRFPDITLPDGRDFVSTKKAKAIDRFAWVPAPQNDLLRDMEAG